MIPFVDFKEEYSDIKNDIDKAINTTLESGRFILGKQVKSFEKEFAAYNNSKYCIGTGNGMEALQLALMALDIKKGDEVITVANTAAATVLAIIFAGATPVFVDIKKDSYNIDPKEIEKAITDKTKAIIPVHLFGQTADMNPIIEIAKKHDLRVIEDACQAHGAEYKGKKTGSMGDIGCFSFYPTKNLGAYGDGGAIITNNKETDEKLRMLRNYGQETRYTHLLKGLNSRLDEIQAAILKVKLKHLDEYIIKRRRKAKLYGELIKNQEIITPIEKEDAKHTYHIYVIRTNQRDKLKLNLKNKEIQTLIHYPIPLHMQHAFKELKHYNLPITEDHSKKILSLPIYPGLEDEKVEEIAKEINSF
jgi:dTDP-4-amino-4,6-dideoxygalactose transaminase